MIWFCLHYNYQPVIIVLIYDLQLFLFVNWFVNSVNQWKRNFLMNNKFLISISFQNMTRLIFLVI